MSQARGHIFIVDNDAQFLVAIRRLVAVGGFKATGVATLSELAACLPFPRRSCVLADILLDGESGLDVPGLLRARSETAPVVFMSASDDAETLHMADNTSSVPCLRKPFEASDLFRSLDMALQLAAGAPKTDLFHKGESK